MIRRSLPDEALGDLLASVRQADVTHGAWYSGDSGTRQPVHTVYVPADRFTRHTAGEYGAEALRLVDTHAPDPAVLTDDLLDRVRAKLAREPVEDLRIDFEDGYGVRDDDQEDDDALAAAREIAAGGEALPPFVGLRVKSFAAGSAARSARTLDVFLTGLLETSGGVLPDGFVITFPKVVAVEHVAVFVEVLDRLEARLGLPVGALRFELQVETTESVIDRHGRIALPGLIAAAQGRCVGAHLGTFDYSAACGLAPGEQRITHPACDFARHVMQVSLAGTAVRLSDGSTNVVPASEDREQVHAAWRLHAEHVAHSLSHGFYQGWDLHPAQLPSRFAAVYGFFLAGLDDALSRLRRWAQQQTRVAGVLDEPATVAALVGFLRRAIDCGVIDEADVLAATGLRPEVLRR